MRFKNYLILLASLLPTLLWSQNQLSLSATEGEAGETVTLDLSMSNDQEVAALQFDLQFDAESLNFTEVATLSTDRKTDHSLTARLVSPGLVRVLVFSPSNAALTGTSGKLVSLSFKSGTKPGASSYTIANALVSGTTGNTLTFSVQGASHTAYSPALRLGQTELNLGNIAAGTEGRANLQIYNDGNRPLTISTLSNALSHFVFETALPITLQPGASQSLPVSINKNASEQFEETLGFNTNDPDVGRDRRTVLLKAEFFRVNQLSLSSGQIAKGQALELEVTALNADPFTSFQFELNLPQGLSLLANSALLSDRKTDHVLSASENGTKLTFLAFSPSNTPFTGSDGVIMRFHLIATANSGNYALAIENAILGTASGENVLSSAQNGAITVLSPEISLSVIAIDLGNLELPEEVSRSLQISNDGNVDLEVQSVNFSSAELSLSQTFPVTISPGSRVNTSLMVKPARSGPFNESLSLVHNDTDDAKVVVTGDFEEVNYLEIEDFNTKPAANFDLKPLLRNTSESSGLQFDLEVPNGFELDVSTFALPATLSGFTLSSAQTSSNTYRIIIFNVGGGKMTADFGKVLTVPIKVKEATSEGNYTFKLANIIISGPTNQNIASRTEDTAIIKVVDNDDPTGISLSASTIAENRFGNDFIGSFSTTDPNNGDFHNYSLVEGEGDTDNANFYLSSSSLYTSVRFDFESQSSHSIRIRTTDNKGGFFEQAFTINVTEEPEAPNDLSLSNSTVAEKLPSGSLVGELMVTDDDLNDTHTFALERGNGSNYNRRFQVVGNQLLTRAVLDFEFQNSLTANIKVTDQTGRSLIKLLTVTVSDANDAPTDISLSANTVAENSAIGTEIGILSSSDQDAADSHSYQLVTGDGDDHNASFSLSADRLLLNGLLDFESLSAMSIRVQSTDIGGDTFAKKLTINITDANDQPTGISLSASTLTENQSGNVTIGTLSTTDPDQSDSHSYQLVTGTGDSDNGSFTIVAGVLTASTPADFEANNQLSVRVRTTDSQGLNFEQAFTINVTDANDSPTDISLSANAVSEAAALGSIVAELSATDVDAEDSHSYSLVSGTGDTDNGLFSINRNDLKLEFTLDFETKSSLSIRLRGTDSGGATFEKAFTLTVNNANEAPTDINLSANTVVENSTIGTEIGTLSSSDQDAADSHSYQLVTGDGDDQNAFFSISADRLLLNGPLDFESLSSMSIRVQSTDIGGDTFAKKLTINITDANDQPTGISLSARTLTENQSGNVTIGTLTTTDPDQSDSHSYQLVAGTGDSDNGSFTIVAGVLTASTPADFEANNQLSVRVRTTDSQGLNFEQAFTINVTDANDSPTDISLSANAVSEATALGSIVAELSSTDADTGDSHSYSLVSGTGDADNGLFSIIGNDLKLESNLDFETKNSLSIRLRGTDTGGATFEKAFTIAVSNANDAPVDISLSGTANLAENQSEPVDIGSLSATDPDGSDSHSFALVAGDGDTDNGSFEIVNNQLRSIAAFDFESKKNLSIRVQTTDALGLSFQKSISITVTDANDVPTDILISNSQLAENLNTGTFIGDLSAQDEDVADSHTYALVSGMGDSGNTSFEIVGSQLLSKASFDFESQNSFEIRVATMDQEGAKTERSFVISIQDANDAPTVSAAIDDQSLEEDQAETVIIQDLNSFFTDVDASEQLSYSATVSTDDVNLQVNSASLSATPVADFFGSVQVTITATDLQDESISQTFDIGVQAVNDAPEFTLSQSALVLAQNFTGTKTITFQDAQPDNESGQSVSYSINPSTLDFVNMTVVGNTLEFTAKGDATGGASIVQINADDGQSENNLATSELSVSVIANVSAPEDIALSNEAIDENAIVGTTIGSFQVTDQDAGDAHTLAFVAGSGDTNNDLFEIVGDQLRSKSNFDFESADTYSIRVRASDVGDLSFEKAFEIKINDLNEAPVSFSLSATSLDENQAVGTTIGTLTTNDPDADNSHVYTLVSGEGDGGNAAFTVDGNVLKTAAMLDFESQSTYEIRLRTTDQEGLFLEQNFTITVSDLNEAPVSFSLSATSLDEKQAVGTTIGTFTTNDPDAGNSHEYVLVSGEGDGGNAAFTVDGNVLKTTAMLDFESQSTYEIRIRTTDQEGLFLEQNFTIAVNDVNEAPVSFSLSATSLDENQAVGTTIGILTTTDPDAGNSHEYTLVSGEGDVGNAAFTVDGNLLKTAAMLDFESQSTYEIRLRTTDQEGLFLEQSFTITVNDVNEAPVSFSLSATSLDENQAVGTTIGILTTTDPDAGNSHEYTLVNGEGDVGNAAFTVDGNVLKTAALLDFESQSTYEIRIRTTDQEGLFLEQSFTITVNDVNEAPISFSLSATGVDENQAVGTSIGSLTTADLDAGNSHEYTLVSGEGDGGNAAYTVDGNVLKTTTMLDFESQSTYEIRLRTTDQEGLFLEQSITITVNDVNESPISFSLSATSLDENQAVGTTIGTLTTTDPDAGNSHEYTLVSGEGDVGNAAFTVDDNVLKTAALLDFESQSTYEIRLRTTDQEGLFLEQSFTITVNDVNEAPEISATISDQNILEDAAQTQLISLANFFTDEDANDELSYMATTASTDVTLSLDGPNLSVLPDQDYFGTLTISVTVTDSNSLEATQDFDLSVEAVNDQPVLSADRTQLVLKKNFAGEEVINLSVAQPDNESEQPISYSLAPESLGFINYTFSNNQLIFTALEGGSGKLEDIQLIVSDGEPENGSDILLISVEVEANNAPTDISLSAFSVDENSAIGTLVGLFEAVDADAADEHSYTLVEGEGSADNGLFSITDNQLLVNGSLDFEFLENPLIRVRATDEVGEYIEKIFTIQVNDVFENQFSPTGIILSNNTVLENELAGTLVGLLTTADSDVGDSHSYALVAGAGDTDNGAFVLEDASLKTSDVFNFEQKSTYTIRLKTTDLGAESFETSIEIAIQNVNEAPNALALSANVLSENEPTGTTVGSLNTTDPDNGDSHTYTLVSNDQGVDSDRFSLNNDQLVSGESFDYEAQSTFSIVVRSNDGGGLSIDQVFIIDLTNLDEPVIGTSGDLTFPDTNIGEDSQLSLTISNESNDGPLDITDLTLPEGFSANNSTVSIPEGGSEVLTITFSPTENRLYTGTLTIVSNAASGNATANLSGRGMLVTSIDPGQVTAEQVNLYPNPTTGWVTLDLGAFANQPPDVVVLKVDGTVLKSHQTVRERYLKLNFLAFAEGTYFIRLSNKNTTVFKRVIMKK